MQDRTSELIARLGYAARGIVYIIVGGLAVLAALGSGGRTTGTKGALYSLLSQPFGWILLGAVATGLLCFAAWRVAQAVLDADHLGRSWKALARRVGFGMSGVINALLGISAIGVALGIAASSSDGESSARDWTAYLLSAPFGQWLVGAIGLTVIGVGIAVGIKGWKGTFQEHLAIDNDKRGWVVPMGRFGFLARGLVFVIIGGFLVMAALHANAGEAKGLAGALQSLQDWPFGWMLLAVIALGLFAFGAFQFVLATYRRIDAPDMEMAVQQVQQQAMAAVRPGT